MHNHSKLLMIRSFEKLTLVLFDLTAIYLSLYIAFMMRKYVVIHIIPNLLLFDHRLQYYYTLFWIPMVSIFFNSYHKLYTRTETFWEDAKEYFKSYAISFILILTIVTLSKQSDKISRILMVLFFINVLWLNLLLRYIIKHILYLCSCFKKSVLIIGAGGTGIDLSRALKNEKYLGYNVIGFLDNESKKQNKDINGTKVLGTIDDIKKISSLNTIEKAFIAIPSLSSEDMMELYIKLHTLFKEVVIIPQIKVMALMNSEIHHLFNDDLFLVNVKNNLNYRANIIIKIVIDYMVSLLIFPFFMAILALIAIIIKVESKGPVFYRHKRYAMNGNYFYVYKFRSMYQDAEKRLELMLKESKSIRTEWDKTFKIKNDPRVTRIGRMLRKTSLDELPQIINVLKGEMSIIGPRPVVQDELIRYYEKYSSFFRKIKPGITGLWQVSGRSDTDYEYRVRSNLWYVLNWSMFRKKIY